ncbi:ArnT family glycosyltransferase [Pseudomonas sp. CR3202]|uniref:ArnT family glycosyltransferase n=1 Tax=Pseudomonas sp. CR3202 TaxID=3351532 RepID=UPI003BF1113F
MLTLVGLHTRPLTPIDETRYISVAWEMWLRGEYLLPIKNGLPYSDKPPLLMWLYQAGWAIFGVNEWWPRLVSPLFSCASLLLTFALGRRLWPQRLGLPGAATLILTSCLLWILFSTSAMFDVMLACLALLAIFGIVLAAGGDARRGFMLFGVALGLGLLAKGPVILLHSIPVALLAPWWRPGLAARRWYAGLAIATLAGVAIALAWAIAAGLGGGEEYRRDIFWQQTAERMVHSFAHRRPLWWYLPLVPLVLFPWLFWPAFWRGARGLFRDGPDPASRFCLAWMVPVFIGFSLISGKQVHYLIPLFPAFALFAARAIDDRTEGIAWIPLVAIAAGAALVALGLDWIRLPKGGLAAPPGLWSAFALILLGPATWALASRTRALTALALFGSSLAALLQSSLSAAIRADYDVTPLATAIHQAQAAGRIVANGAQYHDQFHFAGRLQESLAEIESKEGLVAWLRAHPNDSAVIYLKNPSELDGLPTRAVQHYRGSVAALLDAPTALALLVPEERQTTAGKTGVAVVQQPSATRNPVSAATEPHTPQSPGTSDNATMDHPQDARSPAPPADAT